MTRLILVALLSSCQRTAEAPQPSPAPSPHVVSVDAIDPRKPVPLLPMMAQHQKQNMRDHLAAVQESLAALAIDDFAAVEAASARLGSSPQMAMMCTHMGAGAPGFTEQALGFHQTADTIALAAKKKDRQAVLTALSNTLATCTACHATWKQQVVDEQTWSEKTKTAAPTADEAMQRQHQMMMKVMNGQQP